MTLGPSGSATDTPADPLTTDLATALAADLSGTGPSRFLQVTVGTEGPLARTQILSVPYALRAESAGSADVAATALDAQSVNGLSSDFVTEIFEHTNLDGSGPGNADPTEGLADPDGDGIANFVDPDNDNDGLDDSTEVEQGSDINLVTPILTGVSPAVGITTVVNHVTVNGANFEPGLSVVFGSEAPAPQSLTPTSFEVDVGPQGAGPVDVQVTRLNGETDTLLDAYEFIAFFTHSIALLGGSPVSVTGTQRTALSGTDNYGVDVNVDVVPETLFPFASQVSSQLAVAFDPSGTLVGIRCRTVVSDDCNVEITNDSDADFNLADETGVVLDSLTLLANSRVVFPGLAFDPSGRTVAAYVKVDAGSLVVVAHDRNGDGLFTGTNERVDVGAASVANTSRLDIAVDASGRVGAGWMDDSISNTIRFAWDRSGDGDFTDTVGGNPEIANVTTVPATLACLGVGFAPDGDPAMVWDQGSGLQFARDLNSDGDFADASEIVSLTGSASTSCDMQGGSGFPLAVAHDAGGTLVLLVDRNDDGDFADGNESIALDTSSPTRIAVCRNPVGTSFVATASPNRLYVAP